MDRNPRELWLENLQRQHRATSSRIAAAPMSNLPKNALSHAAFLSTPQYVRQAAAAAANPHLGECGCMEIKIVKSSAFLGLMSE